MKKSLSIFILILIISFLAIAACQSGMDETGQPIPTEDLLLAAGKVDIPECPPVITTNASYVMRGEFKFLYIYEDGSIIYIEEKGLRMPTEENPPERVWKTGKLQEEELNSLINFFRSSHFEELNEYYQFPGEAIEGGSFTMGDMDYAVSIDYEGLHKSARAFGYLTPDGGMTYPDMPYPLNEIYQMLKQIAESKTEEIAREYIRASLLWK